MDIQQITDEDENKYILIIIQMLFSSIQLFNYYLLMTLPFQDLQGFRICFIIRILLVLIVYQEIPLKVRILDSLCLLELVGFIERRQYPQTNLLAYNDWIRLKLYTMVVAPTVGFMAFFITPEFRTSLISLFNEQITLTLFIFYSYMIFLSCLTLHEQKNLNSKYSSTHHLILFLQLSSQIGLILILYYLNFSLDLIFQIKLFSIFVQILILVINQHHATLMPMKSMIRKIIIENFICFPQNHGPYFDMGYYNQGQKVSNQQNSVESQYHSFQIKYFQRIVIYFEMLSYLIISLVIMIQSDILRQYNKSLFCIFFWTVLIIFILNSYFSIKYFYDLFIQFKNQSFQYLTLKYASPSKITQLLKNKEYIVYLNIHQIVSEKEKKIQKQQYQSQVNQQKKNEYQLINDEIELLQEKEMQEEEENTELILMKTLFEFIYTKEHSEYNQNIKISNIFEMSENKVNLNHDIFLDLFLQHLVESPYPAQKRVIFNTLTPEDLKSIKQCLFDRLFKYGYDHKFYKDYIQYFKNQQKLMIPSYISSQQSIIAFQKYIQLQLLTNPKQILYDLYDDID